MSWPMVSLDEHVDILSGFAFKSEFFNGDGLGLPLVRIRDVVPGFSETYYSGEFTEEYLLQDGDMLIGMDGDFNRALWKGGKALLNQRVCKVKAKPASLDQSYLYHFLPKALAKIHAETPAVTVKHLSVKGIRGIKIPLPPLAEQKRIAAILDKADAIRRKRQQAIQLADDFLRSVFLDMFGDPVTNPKGWEVKNLGEMIVKGPTNGLYKPASDYGSGTRILRIDGFYDGVLSDQSKLKRVKITDAEMEKFGLTERSIVINRVNSKEYLGKCGFAQHIEESTVFESNMMNFKVDESKLNPRFLVQQLQMPNIKMQIATCSKDAVNQSSINQNDVKSFKVIVPTIELQNEYENVCKRFLTSKSNYDDSSIFNGELFNSLSQKAFAGEL